MDIAHRTVFLFKHLAIALIAALAVVSSTHSEASTDTWTANDGLWSGSANWSAGSQPNAGDSVVIEPATGAATVTVDVSGTYGALQIASGNTVAVQDGISDQFADSIGNDGILQLSGTGSTLAINGSMTFSGAGTFNLSGGQIASASGVSASLVNTSNTIQGYGSVSIPTGFSGSNSIVNQGIISANVASQTLNLQVDNFSTIQNSGVLQAVNGGLLSVTAGTVDNTGGSIKAYDGSTVSLSVSTLTSGTLSTAGAGAVQLFGIEYGPYLNNVSNLGRLDVKGSGVNISGNFNNSGTVNVGAGPGSSYLSGYSNATITGGGNINILSSTLALSGALVNVDNVISGTGAVTFQSSAQLTNKGLISANVAGKTLSFDLSGASQTAIVNTGLLSATNGATLSVINGALDNTNGNIKAYDSSTVSIGANTLTGGTLSTIGSGVIQAVAGTNGPTFTNVTNLGRLDVITSQAGFSGAFVNSGTLNFVPNSSSDNLYAYPNASLTGGGSVSIQSSMMTLSGSLVNVDNVISGTGTVAFQTSSQLVNQSVISASTAGKTLSFDLSGANGTAIVNTGLLSATNGGTLSVVNGALDNTSGNIKAYDNSTVSIAVNTLTGGTLSTIGNGAIQAASGGFDGTTFSNVTNLGHLDVLVSQVGFSGPLVNSGTLNFAPVNSSYYLYAYPNASLTGGGKVSIAGSTVTLSGSLVNVDNVISGTGAVAFQTSSQLVNQSVISASTAGKTLSFDLSGANGTAIVNTGLLSATNGATLSVVNGTLDNTNGNIKAYDNSTVSIAVNTLTGGTLSTIGNGVIQAASGGFDGTTFSDVTNLGRLDVLVSQVGFSGPLVNSGTLNLVPTYSSGYLYAYPNASLIGGGKVTIAGSITLSGSLANVDNIISGTGTVAFQNSSQLVNQSVISASTAGKTLSFDLSGAGQTAIVNTGLLSATNGAILSIGNGVLDNTNGNIKAYDNSIVAIAVNTLTGGTLSTIGSGVIQATTSPVGYGGPTFSNVTNLGRLDVLASQVGFSGPFVNSGTLNFVNSSNYLYAYANASLTGGGKVFIASSTVTLSGSLVNADNIISGTGAVAFQNSSQLVNQSVISANTAGEMLSFDLSGAGQTAIVNTGLLSATNGAILNVANGTLDNTHGNIKACDTSTVSIGVTTLTGGTLSTVGTGVIQAVQAAGNAPTFVNVTNLGRLDVLSTGLTISGTLTNSGVVTFAGSNSAFNTSGSAILAGNGTVNLSASTAQITGQLVNQGNTIIASGSLAFETLQNGGTLQLNGNQTTVSGTLTQFAGSTLLANNATLVLGAAGFQLNAGLLAGSGTIQGVVAADKATISSTALQISGGLSLTSSSALQFTLGGRVAGVNYSTLTVSGSAALNLNGTISVQFGDGFENQVTNTDTFTVLVSNQSIGGAFLNAPNGSRIATADGLETFIINYGANSPFGADNVVLSNALAVPEPSTWLLAGVGLLALFGAKKR